ncbi:MAG: hypothetical protein JWN25_2047 [Verrucomicrobiales bacterium]|nr:hypothetical protein [Verrucomicrobiales bacterium]
MTPELLMAELEKLGVTLTLNDGKIRYRGRKEVVTSELLEELRKHKEWIIQFLQSKPSNRWTLSDGQNALWFLHQLDPSSASYHMAFCVKISSPIALNVLERAFQATVKRHPLLRAHIQSESGVPFMEIQEESEIRFSSVNASNWTSAEIESNLASAYREPFDFGKGSLIRANLFTLNGSEHIFLITAHHIIFDGQSMWIVVKELFQDYEEQISGKPGILHPPQHTFADYVSRQTKFLQGGEASQLKDFWLNELKQMPPPLDFPSDRPMTDPSSCRGGSQALSLSSSVSEGIKAIAKREGATVFAVLLTVYHIFLNRITGQRDILIGSATGGRNRPEYQAIVGYFINMVVNRARVDENLSFAQMLARVRKSVVAVLNHQEYPYPLVVEAIQKGKNTSRSSLFQAEFGLQLSQASGGILELFLPHEEGGKVTIGSLELSPYPLRQQEGQFDLSLELIEAKGQFYGVFKYNEDLFEPESMHALVEHFQSLIAQIVEHPGVPIRELSVSTDAENRMANELLAICPISPANEWS